MELKRVFITGVGVISGIGNDVGVVSENLRTLKHGFSPFLCIPLLKTILGMR